MVYFKTSQEWLEQATLLLEARPSTVRHNPMSFHSQTNTPSQTRITTKYSIKPSPPTSNATAETPSKPRASLVLKAYDPASGVTLKYRTHKAAEVSRLIYAALGKLGRNMAAVPDAPEEVVMADAPEEEVKPVPVQAAQTGGGGGKKKKKGKK